MRKIYLFATILLTIICGQVNAQLLPTFQFGVKGGVNLTSINTSSTFGNLSGDNRAGFIGGLWARVGGAGLHFQPELYYTTKNVTVRADNTSAENKASFSSLDLPLLIGTRVGALGVGARFNTGPLVSFAINKDQNYSSAFGNAVNLRYKDQNYAWQFGAGLDIKQISFDLRYELGLNKIPTGDGDAKTKINLFNFTVAYRLFGL
ncbi:PorT family protein [Mucilaginibacter sp. RS28]|uniref:PorT family protein n=1 Tax=Mucilaginibacter straminoryzae TaxID=2932774 RepID=A0A9X2BA05_9SPHI|nr:porin family protein [Mucilaginibacter straminoryzae]MCJ8211244.1 PorT family protein [Mucilaginibacter straminoryzae]